MSWFTYLQYLVESIKIVILAFEIAFLQIAIKNLIWTIYYFMLKKFLVVEGVDYSLSLLKCRKKLLRNCLVETLRRKYQPLQHRNH